MMLPLLMGQIVFAAAGIQGAVCPEKGGELCSLKTLYKGKWIETLYRGLDFTPTSGWQGRGPWLWPATGKGEPLPFHGFARDMPWKVLGQTKDSVTLALGDTPKTREKYPYGFKVLVDFKAAGKKVTMRYRVSASPANKSAMPFTAGNHITFNTPLAPGSDALAMTLETPSTVEYLKKDGAPTGETRPRSLAKAVPLGKFEAKTAVSLGGYAGDPAMTLRDPAGLAVRISHTATSLPAEPLVRFNMWGDPAAGYFSPEPWVGLQDAHRLQKGLVRLEPGSNWEWIVNVEFVD